MVLAYNFKDLLNEFSPLTSLTLPVIKANPIKIQFYEHDGSETIYDKIPPLPFINSEVFDASISDWRRLTVEDDGCKVVYEVTFDIKGSNFQFHPGDTIGIIPRNEPSEVDLLIKHLNLSEVSDLPYRFNVDKSVKGTKIPPHLPVQSTLRHVLSECVDLRCIMKKLFIRALAEHTKDENERKVLEYLCSKEGSTTYTTHVLNKNLCLLDLLTIFKTCQPPVEVILSYLSRLLPRPYSIVNSQSKDPNKLKICFSVIDIGNNRKGLTTSWLENVIQKECVEENLIENGIRSLSINETNESQNQPVPIYIRKNLNQFLLPEDIQTPLLLLGPGTGVAPFIGFLEERESNQTNIGDIWLYFGCRNPELDFIYKEELDGFLANGVLTRLCTAFSRVEGDMKYIQDALLRDGEEVVKFIEKGAAVFICGDLKNMAAQIKETLVKCFVLNGNTQDEAEKYIADMQKDKRYFVDTWS